MDCETDVNSTGFARTAAWGGAPVPRVLVINRDSARPDRFDDLDRYGFRVTSVSNLDDGLRDVARKKPSLVILDLSSNRTGWVEILQAARSACIPVIIVIKQPTDEFDCVRGLDLGADDCITESTGLRELVARIRAVLRGRRLAKPPARHGKARGRYRFGGWVLNRRLQSLTDPAGDAVALSKGEYALLVAFVDAPQTPRSREQLLRAMRLREDVFDRSVDVAVLRLRRKMEADPSTPRLIRTERGVGYIFTLPVEYLG